MKAFLIACLITVLLVSSIFAFGREDLDIVITDGVEHGTIVSVVQEIG